MTKIFLIAVLFLTLKTNAQDTALTKPVDSSSVTVHKDQRLDLLITRQIQANELASRDARRTAKGFRLLIISTNNRDEAIATKTKVYTHFPELKSYLWYQSPYYRVKAGNFKERKEAEEYQKKLNAYFPKGVFIMNDIVEVKLDIPWEEEL
jgi:hypothetical protein